MIHVRLSKENKLLTPTNGAYVAGLIFGWASRLKNPEALKDVINDMNKFAKVLAIRSGVTLFEKTK